MKQRIALVVLVALAVFDVVQVRQAYADGNDPSTNTLATPVAVISTQAATVCVESTVAAAAATAVTVPAVAGQYFYITNVSSMVNAIAAPVATLYATTSTNVPGSYSVRQAVQAAVGSSAYVENFPGGLKTSVAGVATTFAGTALANASASFRVCGFYAK